MYEHVYAHMVSLCANGKEGILVYHDFEKAAMNAIRKKIGPNALAGCFFYFFQAVHKHVQNLGHSVRYGKCADFRLLVTKLIALAFVPHHLVYTCALGLVEEFDDDDKPLLDYFLNTWVGKLKRAKRVKPNKDGIVEKATGTWGKPMIQIEEVNAHITVRLYVCFNVEIRTDVPTFFVHLGKNIKRYSNVCTSTRTRVRARTCTRISSSSINRSPRSGRVTIG